MGSEMMEIVAVNGLYNDKLRDFLKGVEGISDIDEGLINNAMILLDDDEIIGAISYEKFSLYGLIRYFVFKRKINQKEIIDLFNALAIKAYDNGINRFFSIIVNLEVYELFKELGFQEIDKSSFFIEEENIKDTKYSNSIIMIKEIGGAIC